MPKGCTHIASIKSTECPDKKNQGGQSGLHGVVFICICSTGVIPF